MAEHEQEPKAERLRALARQARDVQDACNAGAVARGLVRVLDELAELVPGGRPAAHPIAQAWIDKLASLAGVQGDVAAALHAHGEVDRLASGGLSHA